MSLIQLAMLFALSLIVAVGAIALLSVLVAIFTYYGFAIHRTADGLTIRRGLLTRHEIHVKKSRIQTVTIRQDWLDRLLGRRNVILERISHSQSQEDPWSAQKRKIFVPSVREHETRIVTDEILPGCRIDDLPFTPIRIRYFYKRVAIASVVISIALGVAEWLPNGLHWLTLGLLAVWPLVVGHAYMTWKRGGLVVDGDFVVARSGTIGIDYRIFPASKAQDVTHIQSVLMRRHHISSLRFHTASTTITVPYMGTEFMRAVLDYVVFRVESSRVSWM